MAKREMSEERLKQLRETMAKARAARWENRDKPSRVDQAIEHVAGGVLWGELDQIESAIDRKESSLSRLKTDEDVSKLRVKAANEELAKVVKLTALAKERLDEQVRVNMAADKSMTARLDELKMAITQEESRFVQTQRALNELKAEISERTTYRVDQEKEIEEMVEKGNDRLYEVDQEVKELLRKRDEVQQEVSELEKQSVDVRAKCAVSGARFRELEVRYDQTAEKYRNDLMATRAQITDEQANIVELKIRAKEITDDLIVKGKAALARESAIASREAELISRERLLKSRESRYS